MKERWILWMIELVSAAAAGLSFVFITLLQKAGIPGELVLKTYRELSGFLRKKETTGGWYRQTEKWLAKNGASFHYGKWIRPERYLALRLVFAFLGMGTAKAAGPVCGGAVAAALFFAPGGLLYWLNRRDNERMLPELKLIYHALEIQIRAGVYVTDALAECYGSVREPRLRSALLDLAGDIVMKADLYDALDRFQGKFDNRYVDTLCIIILQALESGQALELLGDIGEQIKDMEAAALERKKAALDRSITFYQLGALAVVLGIALYGCVVYLFGAASAF